MRKSAPYQLMLALLAGCSSPETESPSSPAPPPVVDVPPKVWDTDSGGEPVRDMLARDAATAVVRGEIPGHFIGGASALGDLTGNGHPDLVVNSWNSEIRGSYLLAGPLQGDLHPSDAFGFVPHGGWGLGIGDLNGDGQADLAVLRGPILDWYEFHVYYGPLSINAPPSQPNAILRPDQTSGSLGQVCDANLDGVADLAMSYAPNAMRFALGPLTERQMGEEAVVVFEGDVNGSPSPGRKLLCGHDFTGDGAADLLFNNDQIPRDVWLVHAPPWEGWNLITDIGAPIPALLNAGGALGPAGDVTGDGYLDLYVDSGRGHLVAGPVHHASEPFAVYDWDHGPSDVLALGDLDGDGVDDLVFSVGSYDAGGGRGSGAVFLMWGPVSPGVYEPEDVGFTVANHLEHAYFGSALFRDEASDTWGATAWNASETHNYEGHVYLFSGWPGPL